MGRKAGYKSGPGRESASADGNGPGAETVDDFTTQFRAAYRVLWLIASGILSDRALAEDAVQEAAIIALQKWRQFKPGTSFNAWMGQIVRFVALNQSRSERKRRATGMEPASVEHLAEAVSDAPDPDALKVSLRGELPENQRHFDDCVMQALSGLTDVARTCLLLRVLEGLEYSEISLLLGIPEGTAMSHVHRSRKALRARLGESPVNRRGP